MKILKQQQNFHDIYRYEGLLLKSFFNSHLIAVPPCQSFDALLQTLEKYYTGLRQDKQLHYMISDDVMRWRSETNYGKDNPAFTQRWMYDHGAYLVEVPRMPPNWIDLDPIQRPVPLSEIFSLLQQPVKRLSLGPEKVEFIRAAPPNTVVNTFSSPRVLRLNEHEEIAYEPSANLRWRDTVKNKVTNVIIARNKQTGLLEIHEQQINPMLQCIAEVVVQPDRVFLYIEK